MREFVSCVGNRKHVSCSHTIRPLTLSRRKIYFLDLLALLTSCRGTTWLPVDGCQRVQHPLVCNLTGTFSDRSETYSTTVTARLGGRTSNSSTYNDFQPIRDSKWRGIHFKLELLSSSSCLLSLSLWANVWLKNRFSCQPGVSTQPPTWFIPINEGGLMFLWLGRSITEAHMKE